MDRTSLLRWLLGGSLVVLLLACGTSNTGNGGTRTGGSISITTDHTTYATTDSIKVGVTNHAQSAIYALDTRAGCTILDLEIQVNRRWQPSNAARCPLGRRASIVEIAPGQTYTGTINAGTGNPGSVALPLGTYRLVLSYTKSASAPARRIEVNSETVSVTN